MSSDCPTLRLNPGTSHLFAFPAASHQRTRYTMTGATATCELRARYSSPSDSHVFQTPLGDAAAAAGSTADKTAYLNDLRAKVTGLQEEVNEFLTRKMGEDNATSVSTVSGVKRAVDDKKQEDMYGEEEAEDDS